MMATEDGSRAGLARTKVRHRTTQQRIRGARRKFCPAWESIDFINKKWKERRLKN